MTFFKAAALILVLYLAGRPVVSLAGLRRRWSSGETLWLSAVSGTAVAALCALLLGYLSSYGTPALLLFLGLVTLTLNLTAFARERRVMRKAGMVEDSLHGGDEPAAVEGMNEGRRGTPCRVPGCEEVVRRRRLRFREALVVLALAAVGLILYSPPWRIVYGWSDGGIYPNMAANLARKGEFSVVNRTAPEMMPENAELLYYRFDDRFLLDTYYENQFYAFEDLETGREWPLFFHLWSSLMAVFASFLGLSRMFWALTWVAILSLCGFFLLARRFVGPRWALAALILYALSPLTLYFTRYTLSECMNLALFLGGGLCLILYLQEGETPTGKGAAALAAFLLGMGFLCRVDFLFLLVPLYIFFTLKAVVEGWDGADRVFILCIAACALLAVLAGLFFARVYFLRILGGFIGDARLGGTAGGVAVLLACLLGVKKVREALRRRVRKLWEARIPWAVVVWGSLALLFAWLYFIRPRDASPLAGYGFIKAEEGPSYVNQSFLRWAWYLSPLGLALIFAGYAYAFNRARIGYRRENKGRFALALCGLSFTILYALNMRALPIHILCMRRLVPVILPIGLMMVAWSLRALAEAGRLMTRGKGHLILFRAGRVITALVFIYLVAYAFNASQPLFGLDESGNQWELFSAIAGDVEEGATVLLDYHGGDIFGVPLRSLYDVETAWLKEDTLADVDKLSTVLADLGFPRRPLYILWRPSMSGEQPLLPPGVEAEPVSEYLFREVSLEKRFDARPERTVGISEGFRLYRLIQAVR